MIKSRLPVTFKCLYNTASLSGFTFCLSPKIDVHCLLVGLGVVNAPASTLLVIGVLQSL